MYTFNTKGNDVEKVFYIFNVFKGGDPEGFALGIKTSILRDIEKFFWVV